MHPAPPDAPDRRTRGPFSLALAIHRLFPWGGLQRDALRTAREARERGHDVTLLVGTVDADTDTDGLRIDPVRFAGRTNHARASSFAADVGARARAYDAVLGFDHAPGLDLYFAGDRCYVERVARTRGALARVTPRYRTYARLEREVFRPEGRTCVLLLAEAHRPIYQRHYGTPDARFEVLPPGIDPARRRGPEHKRQRAEARNALGIDPGSPLVLHVGSDFRRKGVDRALEALARSKRADATLAVAGAGDPRPHQRLAVRLGIDARVRFLGPRDDVPALLAAADVLLHPARTEAAGAVLLEALAAGTPVVASDACGYAPWVERSEAGAVVGTHGDLAGALDDVLARSEALGARALRFVDDHPELFTMHARIVDAWERAAERRGSAR